MQKIQNLVHWSKFNPWFGIVNMFRSLLNLDLRFFWEMLLSLWFEKSTFWSGGPSRKGELFKFAKFKNPIFRNGWPCNFFVFWATTTIHTFLKSSDNTVIIRQGQKSDIATGQGSGAKFSLYRRTHCSKSETQLAVFHMINSK